MKFSYILAFIGIITPGVILFFPISLNGTKSIGFFDINLVYTVFYSNILQDSYLGLISTLSSLYTGKTQFINIFNTEFSPELYFNFFLSFYFNFNSQLTIYSFLFIIGSIISLLGIIIILVSKFHSISVVIANLMLLLGGLMEFFSFLFLNSQITRIQLTSSELVGMGSIPFGSVILMVSAIIGILNRKSELNIWLEYPTKNKKIFPDVNHSLRNIEYSNRDPYQEYYK